MAVSQPPVTGAPTPRTGFLSADRWERLAPLTGVATVVLFIAGGIVLDGAAEPADDAPARAYVTYFDDEQGSIYGGSLLFMLGIVFLMWFAGAVRAYLAAAEGGTHRLASVGFGGATVVAVLMLAALGSQLSGAFAVDEDVALTGEAAQALFWAGDGLFYAAFFGAAVFVLANAVVMLRTGALPRWLAWASLALGVILLIPWVGWAGFIFLMPIWILVVAVLLWRGQSAAGPT
jgi:hypothetical protein